MTLAFKFPPSRSDVIRPMRAAAALRRLFGWPARVLAARRVLLRLGALTDRELKDIGLYRQDLRDASAFPRDADPGLMLRRKVEARRNCR